MTMGQSLDRHTPALALSGGGFRATLFHCGALMRLNELGFLTKLSRISSVSGGAITSGVPIENSMDQELTRATDFGGGNIYERNRLRVKDDRF